MSPRLSACVRERLNLFTMKGVKREFSELSNRVIGCAIEVHRVLGAGLLESTYRQCLGTRAQVSFMVLDELPLKSGRMEGVL